MSSTVAYSDMPLNTQQQQQQSSDNKTEIFPSGTIPLETQVAGHTFTPGTNLIGLLKDKSDGSVLKPLGKPDCGAREIAFYESVNDSEDIYIKTLKNFTPTYYGTVKMILNKLELKFIKLNDLTLNMFNPCIIDLKIGKRTWDPLATKEKILAEEEKYAECKKFLGFCIPGFQVHVLATKYDNFIDMKLERYGKDYGKKLNPKTCKDTLRMFLNGQVGLCAPLVNEILQVLWSIQKWSRSQNVINMYSSSILIAYDARRLKHYLIQNSDNYPSLQNKNSSNLHPFEKNIPSEFHSLEKNGIFCTSMDKIKMQNGNLSKNHICQNGYDKIELYNFGVTVKMIDFAHVFPSDSRTIDSNYLFGIENLVNIFEEFLEETICKK